MVEREPINEGSDFIDNNLQPDEVWEERIKADIIWEGGNQSLVIPIRTVIDKANDQQTFHPDLTKYWD